MKPRPELLALAETCGAKLTGKPAGSEAITIVFTIDAWQLFDATLATRTSILNNALWKACGDDEATVNAYIESQTP